MLAILNTIALIVYVSVNSRSKIAVDKADQSLEGTKTTGTAVSTLNALATVLADQNKTHSEDMRAQNKAHADQLDKVLAEMAAQREQSRTAQEDYRVLGDARTRQFEKLYAVGTSNAETLSVFGTKLEAIEGQSKQLQETKELLNKIAEDIGRLPESMREKLKAELADIKLRLDQLEAAVSDLNSHVVKAIEVVVAAPPPPPVNQTVNVTTTAPTALPEQPKTADAAPPAVEPDPTQKLPPGTSGVPNGQTTTETKP